MQRKKIDSEISAILLAAQAGLAYFAFISQKNGMNNETEGVSLGMFAAIFIFSAVNAGLSLKSFNKNKTFSTFFKIVPYSVTAIAYLFFSYKCINSRLAHSGDWYYDDDVWTLIILLSGYGLYLIVNLYKGLISKVFDSPETWGHFSGFTVAVAHSMFAVHMILHNSSAGITTQYILLTLIASSIRFVQNLADIGLSGLDHQKKALIVSELWNIFTWIAVGIIFFLYRQPQ